MSVTFEPFPKIPRLRRDCVITEKIDGTNAQIIITEDGEIGAASRKRLITPQDDNYGFANWVHAHADELRILGPGRHFGEWWGRGIQRGYDLDEKRFSLFNVNRWEKADLPDCLHVVPILARANFDTSVIDACIERLETFGSEAAPGYMKPEGIVVFHAASGSMFKRLIENDEIPKGEAAA